jgi:putative RecB family exonuclease
VCARPLDRDQAPRLVTGPTTRSPVLVTLVVMSLPLPTSLTPSKVTAFKECALAFRLSAIDKLPEPPSLQAFRGTVVHRALELLMWDERQGERTLPVAFAKLERALDELLESEEGAALGLAGPQLAVLVDDAHELLRNYFVLEDPNSVRVIGTELRLQAEIGLPAGRPRPELLSSFSNDPHAERGHGPYTGSAEGKPVRAEDGPEGGVKPLRLRGVIDRLELDEQGELVVTDYKTGRAPGQSQEQARLGGVHFYAFLCEQVLGRRPAKVQLFHLREPLAICTTPSEQSINGLERQATAIWAAVKRACSLEDFRPKPGPLCDWCGFHAYCPARGGDLSLARPEHPVGADQNGDAPPAPRLFPLAASQ